MFKEYMTEDDTLGSDETEEPSLPQVTRAQLCEMLSSNEEPTSEQIEFWKSVFELAVDTPEGARAHARAQEILAKRAAKIREESQNSNE